MLTTMVDSVNPASFSPSTEDRELAEWCRELHAFIYQEQSTLPESLLSWRLAVRALIAKHQQHCLAPCRSLLLEFCCCFGDWPLAIFILQLWPQYQRDHHLTLLLARCYRKMGYHAQARALLQSALLREPFHAHFIREYHNLLQDPFTRYEDYLCRGPISLVPLQAHHRLEYRHQYRDPNIAEACHLPHFANDDAWLTWLADMHARRDRQLFAVNHANWGFVGSVCLRLYRGIGFFYYWIGVDFQGRGYGPAAVACLLDMASRLQGMTACYAKTACDNQASLSALAKLEFTRLPFQARFPDDREVFFYRGPTTTDAERNQQLHQLLLDMDSPLQLIRMPIAASPQRAASFYFQSKQEKAYV